MDVTAAIGLVAAPGIVAGIVAAFKPLLLRYLTDDVIPPLAILTGAVYCVAAWQAGVIDVQNPAIAVMLGVTVGLSASGLYEVADHYRHRQ